MSGSKSRSPCGSHVPDPTPTLSPVSQVASSADENDPNTSLNLNGTTMSPDLSRAGAGSAARRIRVLKVIVPSRSSSFRRYQNGRKPTRVYTLPRNIRVYPDEGENTVTIRNVEPAPTASPEFEVVRADDVIDVTNSHNTTYSNHEPVEVVDKAVVRSNYGSSSLGFYDPGKVRYLLQSAMDPPSEKYVYVKKEKEPDWVQRRETRGSQAFHYLPANATHSDPGAPVWEARLDNDTEVIRPSSSASGRGGGKVLIKEAPVLKGFQNHDVILEQSSSREVQEGSGERVKSVSELETTSARQTQSPVLRIEPHVSRIEPQVARTEPPPSTVKTHEVLTTDAEYAVGANYRADCHRDRYSLLTPHYDRSLDIYDHYEERRDKYEAPPRVFCLQPVYHHNWVPSPRGPVTTTILNSATLHEFHKPRNESGSGARVIEVEGFYDTMCLNCHQCVYSCKRDLTELECSSDSSSSSCCTVRRWTFVIGVLSLLVFVSLLITLLVTTGRCLVAKDVANTKVAYLVCGNVFLMAEITFAVLLLYGAFKNSPNLLFAWVVWNIVAICLLFLVSGLVIILASSSSSILSHMLLTPVVLFPRVLALAVVFSHYRRVKDDQQPTEAQPE